MSDPQNRRPPPRKKPPAPKPAPIPQPMEDYDDHPAPKESNTKTWIVVMFLCVAMAVGVLYQRGELFTPQGPADQVENSDKSFKKKKKKRKRRKRKRRSKKRTGDSAALDIEEEELWEDEDLPDDDRFTFGDILSEPDEYEEVAEVVPEEKFVPPKKMWDPNGSYRPRSQWAAPGAAKEGDAVEISMSGPDNSAPLDPSQIQRVLNEDRLMSCYDEIARKVPDMKGRVHIKVQIEGNGKPSRVKITKSQLRSRMVEDCIVSKIRRMRFPAAAGGQRTRFSTRFDFD